MIERQHKMRVFIGSMAVALAGIAPAGVAWSSGIPATDGNDRQDATGRTDAVDRDATGPQQRTDVNSSTGDSPVSATSSVASAGFFLEDLIGFNNCVRNPTDPGCNLFDFNGDGFFNVLDYGPFQVDFMGNDCNDNRISDTQDIANQTSRDANDNGIPDECEVLVVAFGQPPTANQGNIPSNIDWTGAGPNVVVTDNFFAFGNVITSVRWWGRQLLPAPGPPISAPDVAGAAPRDMNVAAAEPPDSSGAGDGRSRRIRYAGRQLMHPGVTSGQWSAQRTLPLLPENEEAAHPDDKITAAASVQGVPGDTCAQPFPVSAIPFGSTGTTCGFIDDYDEQCDPDFSAPGSPDVVYTFSPTADITVDISLCRNSAYDTKLYVYENACGSFQSGDFVACSEDFCSTPSFAEAWVSTVVQVPLLAGNAYFIVVDGFDVGGCGTYTIDITESPAVCGPGNGDCFAPNGTAGCEDETCCQTVCAGDPFCCGAGGGSWDQFCSDDAAVLCQPVCGPGTGDCFTGNGTPGCEDITCCDAVCAADSFCCGANNGFWDAFCGDRAIITCGDPPRPLAACPAGSLSAQPASSPITNWAAGASDAGWFQGSLLRFENFDGVVGPICDLHWWGLNTFNDGDPPEEFLECVKNPDAYEIKLYADQLGEPGAEVCSYSVAPTRVDTGLTYAGFPLYEYATDLGSCCALDSGWVSIQGVSTGDNCVFLWMSSSEVAAGFHWLDDPVGARTTQDYDLNICLAGEPLITGWLISFHEPLDTVSPPAEPLGLYFCDAGVVAGAASTLVSCDAPSIELQQVELADCCLIHANPDSRTSQVPAGSEAFREEAGLLYDIDIQAVAGHRFVEDPQTGVCVETATGAAPAGDFWAWHTTGVNFIPRSALTGSVTMGLKGEWLYGPWDPASPACGSANMAFELLTLELPAPP